MILPPFRIGNVCIDTPLIAAPMAGVSDMSFRTLCREQGAGMVCMEMVSAKAIHFKNKNTEALLRTSENEHPVSLQIFGSEPELMAEVAASIEERPFDVLDVNMGCPVPKVVNNHEGSALMNDEKLAGEIIEALVKSVKKPVTVKFRKGFDDAHVNAVEFAKRMEAAGASAVCVHGRTRAQYYSGKADWDIIAEVKKAVKIPVIGNGDITGPESALAMIEHTGCDAVMIGRAAQGNPWIFASVKKALETGEAVKEERPSLPEIKSMIRRHASLMKEEKGEYIGIREMRKHMAWYLAGFPNAAALRKRACSLESFEEIDELLDEVQEERKL